MYGLEIGVWGSGSGVLGLGFGFRNLHDVGEELCDKGLDRLPGFTRVWVGNEEA